LRHFGVLAFNFSRGVHYNRRQTTGRTHVFDDGHNLIGQLEDISSDPNDRAKLVQS
jgi:hypothetical protein